VEIKKGRRIAVYACVFAIQEKIARDVSRCCSWDRRLDVLGDTGSSLSVFGEFLIV